jgi:hypothetical protein
MYATHAADRYAMVKIEQQDRLARAHRRLAESSRSSSSSPKPAAVGSATLRRRAAVALATFLLSLGILAGAAAAQDLNKPAGGNGADSGCVRVAGGRVVC